MTDLTITPDIAKKRLKLVGRVASGEKVAVTVLGFGSASTEGLRLRVMAGMTAVGVFPLEDGDEWRVDGANLTCALNLSTEQADRLCRFGAETCVILEDTATPQLYGVADLQLCPWMKLADVDVPVNLDNYKVKIGGLEDEIAQIRDSVGEIGNEIARANEALDPIRELKGIEVKTNTTNGMRNAIKAIARALGVVSVKTFALCTLCAGGAEVTTAALGDLDLDTDPRVVTDVSFDGLATEGYVDASLSSKADASALSAYATSNDLSSVASSVSAVWEQVFGESVWIAVTNYMRATDAKPSMGLWERRDGATNLVWSSAEEIGARTDAVRAELTNAVAEARSAADSARAWGRFQSADGADAPDGFTMVTTPYLMMTGGGAWEQRTLPGGGSYWLFCGGASVGGAADGAFRMLDSQGASVFEVTAGSVREVPAVPSSFRVVPDGDSPGYNSVIFAVNATSLPKVYWTTDLAGAWAEVSGTKHELGWRRPDDTTYEFYFKISRDYESAFFKAVYETGAEPVVDFKRPLRLSRVELGGTNYAVSVGVMSDGTKFLKLEGE